MVTTSCTSPGVRAEQGREQVLTEEGRSVGIECPEQRGRMVRRGHGRTVVEAVVAQQEAVGQPVVLDRPGRRGSGRDRTVGFDVDETIEQCAHDLLPLVISEVARIDGRGITTEPDTDRRRATLGRTRNTTDLGCVRSGGGCVLGVTTAGREQQAERQGEGCAQVGRPAAP